MSIYGQKARALRARFERDASKARSAGLRAAQLPPKHRDRDAELAAISAERADAFNAYRREMAAIAETAREYATTEQPKAIERSFTMLTAERVGKANAVREMLTGAPLNELLAVANDAARTYAVPTLYAIRLLLSNRDEEPSELAPIFEAIDAPHAERAADAVRDCIEAQLVASHAVMGGPFAVAQAGMLANTELALTAHRQALRVELDGQTIEYKDSDVRAKFTPEELSIPSAEVSDQDARTLFELGVLIDNGAAHKMVSAAA